MSITKTVIAALALAITTLGLPSHASAATADPSPTIETLPTRMKVADVHRPKVTAVPGTRVVLKYSNVFDTATGKVLERMRNAQPGHRYRVVTNVVFNRIETVQRTETEIIVPAVPEHTVTKTWLPSECDLVDFTPTRWRADQVLTQKRLDMSGPPPGVWVEAERITGRTYGDAIYSCPMDDGTTVTKGVEAIARIAWTTATPEDYMFVFGWPNPVTMNGVIQITPEDFNALRASIYWQPGTTYTGCDQNPYTPCSPNTTPISYSYRTANENAPAHTDRLDQIKPVTADAPLQLLTCGTTCTHVSQFSHTYVVPAVPAVTETRTWTETVVVANDVTKYRTQYFRVIR